MQQIQRFELLMASVPDQAVASEIEANLGDASQSSAGLSEPFTIVVSTSGGAESTRQMLRSSTLMWICVVYLAGVGVFLTIAERAPIDPGCRYSDDN